jgi:Fur family transcriptional regulator, ferric uptake regulator
MKNGFAKGITKGWPSRFRGWGYRVTIPRRIILQILENAEKHFSAEEIYLQAYKVYPAIGLTTVYRTLDLLIKNGVVLKVESGEGRARYELAGRVKGVNCHQHLLCMNCHTFLDSSELTGEEQEVIKKMKDRLYQKYGFTVKSCILQFYGECQDCQKNKNFYQNEKRR